jgi:hypothetical protein
MSRKSLWLSIALSLLAVPTFSSHSSAAYVVEGVTLGAQIPMDARRAYSCTPSSNFEGYSWCQREQRRGNSTLSTTIMYDEKSSTTIYLMANVAPTSVTRAIAQKEIEQLSAEFKERPTKVDWVQRRGSPTSVTALWGDIELEKLEPEDVQSLAAGE